MKSREQFVKQVAKNIKNNHESDSNASYIFGISGKWGEGKTTFLDGLKIELEKDDKYKVIKINPWKFASDRISLIRFFLIELLKTNKQGFKSKIREILNGHNSIQQLNYDISSVSVNWGIIIVCSIWIIVFTLLYSLVLPMTPYLDTVNNFYNSNKSIIKIVLTTIAIPIILSILSSQQSSKSISTVDRFDDLLKKVLDNNKNNKLIIFVDDLDRVTARTARDVLDNLRTFFDQSRLTFVVTGDHTVLERYIGRQTLPRKSEPEQIEEGRRYLKKIFNVYWRLPVPLEGEFASIVDDIWAKRKPIIEKYFKSDDERKTLRNILEKYFDKNFRHIERFIDNLCFTFGIIEIQLGDATDEEKKYVNGLLDNPGLVVRILMLQDFCAQLFEKIIWNPKILYDLERAAGNNEPTMVNKIIEDNKESMTPTQRAFLMNFIFESPMFYDGVNLKVPSLQPFLYLAADASLGDKRGPVPEDFKRILTSGDSSQISKSLLTSGIENITEATKTSKVTLMENRENLDNYKKFFVTLMTGLIELPNEHISHNEFFTSFNDLDTNSVFKKMPSTERVESMETYWQWLDKLDQSKDYQTYLGDQLFATSEDFTHLVFEDGKSYGHFTSRIMAKWFVTLYPQDPNRALAMFSKYSKSFDKEQTKLELSGFGSTLINDFLVDNNSATKNQRFVILNEYSGETVKSSFKTQVLDAIKSGNRNIADWYYLNLNLSDWNREEVEGAVIEHINSTTDGGSLINSLDYCSNKIEMKIPKIWEIILTEKLSYFFEIYENFNTNSAYSNLAPDQDNAIKLFEIVLSKVKEVTGETNKWLNYLNRDKWIWKNMTKIPDERHFSGLKRSKDENIKNKTLEVLSSWKSE